MTSFNPNYLSKAPPPNTITLGVRASTYESGGDIVRNDDTSYSVLKIKI